MALEQESNSESVEALDIDEPFELENTSVELLIAVRELNSLLVRLNINLERLGEALPKLRNSPIAKWLGVIH